MTRSMLTKGKMVDGVSLVRLKGTRDVVAKVLLDKTGVYRYLTKYSDGRWREQPSRAAFKTMEGAMKEVGQWI